MARPAAGGVIKRCLPVLLLAAGTFCVILGRVRGEAPIMFEKAVRICLECIGIG